jgi:hypothetical protein
VKLASRVYYTRHAWLQILTNKDKAVVRFSITVTDPRFGFPIRDLTVGGLEAKLGHSRFSEISPLRVDGRNLRVVTQGVRRQYSELYRVGSSAFHQYFVLSYNDAGTGTFGRTPDEALYVQDGDLLIMPDLDVTKYPEYARDTPWAQEFRSKTIINTLIVFNADYITLPTDQESYRSMLARLLGWPGPDQHSVGVLVPDAQTRRKLHQRISMYERVRRESNHQSR